jgi:hypothetical protein
MRRLPADFVTFCKSDCAHLHFHWSPPALPPESFGNLFPMIRVNPAYLQDANAFFAPFSELPYFGLTRWWKMPWLAVGLPRSFGIARETRTIRWYVS